MTALYDSATLWSEPDVAVAAAPAVEIRNVAKAYGPAGSHVLALGRISLAVAPGEFRCLVGASGCGEGTLRDLLHDELERVWQETGVTVLFVTHTVREAVRLGDRVLVLSSRPGRVVDEFPVDIERPRRMECPDVAALSSVIVDRLRQEVRRHGDA